MSSREARANFSELLGSVYFTKNPVIVEKKGKAMAVVISPDQYKQLEKIKADGWAVVDEIRKRNADKDPDEVYKDVTAVVEEVRQEMYEAEKKKASKRRRWYEPVRRGLIIEKGYPFQLIEQLRKGAFVVITSPAVREELEEVLRRDKFTKFLTEQKIAIFLDMYDVSSLTVTPNTRLPVPVRDPKDEKVLATALGGKAEYLVTGDDDLLVLNNNPAIKNLKVITVKDFLDLL